MTKKKHPGDQDCIIRYVKPVQTFVDVSFNQPIPKAADFKLELFQCASSFVVVECIRLGER